MRRALLVVLVLVSLASCKGDQKKKAKPGAQPARCSQDADCDSGWVCLAGACTDPSAGAIYTDPSNAVTPDKVKQHVEDTAAQHGKDIDQALEQP